ncbi:mitochondrial carrier domain-containing protein [Dichotomocladium elegans]|nr:mitochondrial carrier domain-containing protein [Dichotomocladium elegans]
MATSTQKDIAFEDYKLPPIGHAVSGAVGSTIANLFIYPLDIATTRLQLDDGKTKRGILEVLTHMVQDGGIKSLYQGLGADTLATVLSSFIYFYCYTSLRNVQEKLNVKMGRSSATLNVAQELFLGAEAALISRLFTTPVSNVTTRLQTNSGKGFMEAVMDIYHDKGIRGFWTGYRASIVLVSNPSITYFWFEKTKAFYLKANQKAALTSPEVFLLSALAKSVATMITYPFIFVRTSLVAMKSSEKKGMIQFIHDVIEKEGPQGIYKGMRAQILKGFFNQGIMYMIKDRVATWLALLFYTSMVLKRRSLQK